MKTADEAAAETVEGPRRGIVPIPDRLGPLHDRSLGGVLGFLIGVGAIRYVTPDANAVHAGLIFGASTGVGAVLAKYVPARFRELLQATLFLAAVLVGGSFLVTQ